jgi:N-acetylmuramoyl-L-alanine amidase
MLSRLQKISRVVLSIGHQKGKDTGAVNTKTGETENDQCFAIVAKIMSLLKLNGMKHLVLSDMSLTETCNYINTRCNSITDICFELHKDSFDKYDPTTMHRRMGVYGHPYASQSMQIAHLMKDSFLQSGAQADTWARVDTDRGFTLAFVRRPKGLSFVIEAGFIEGDNSEDEQWFYAITITKAIMDILEKPFNKL